MHSLLENYISELEKQLDEMPEKQRKEELREMRIHLQSALDVAEGSTTDEETARAVISQFGPIDAVADEIVAAWRRGEALKARSFWGAAGCALAGSLALFVLEVLERIALRPEIVRLAHTPSTFHTDFSGVVLLSGIAALLGVILRFFVGGLSGYLFPKRGVAGVSLTMAAGTVFSIILVFYLGVRLAHHALQMHQSDGFIVASCLSSIVAAMFASGTTILAAWAGSRWRIRRDRRVIAG